MDESDDGIIKNGDVMLVKSPDGDKIPGKVIGIVCQWVMLWDYDTSNLIFVNLLNERALFIPSELA